MLRGHRDPKVYQLAYKLAMEIFHLSKSCSERRSLLADKPNSSVFSQRCGELS